MLSIVIFINTFFYKNLEKLFILLLSIQAKHHKLLQLI